MKFVLIEDPLLSQGTPAESLCLSERYVYALTSQGEVLIRFGVSEDNTTGDYWKKVPGAFKAISG